MNDISLQPRLSRRAAIFCGLSAAGGLAIGFPVQAAAKGLRKVSWADGQNPKPEMTAFLVIDPDSTVTIRLPHQEMGQGTSTALAMMVAEELNCDWAKVRVEYASANRNVRAAGKLYGGMQTVGSAGVRSSVSMMQQAGASARERLRLAAAQRWKVDPADCSVTPGKCLHKASNRSFTYGELAPDAAKVVLASEPAIKTPDQFKLLGKWTPRLDTAPKLDGSAQFGLDAKVDGMVYADVLSCPEFGGKLVSVDETPIQGRRGVLKVVKTEDAVIVVADRYWRARSALNLLKPVWASGGASKVDSAQLDKAYRDALDGPLVNAKNVGDAPAELAKGGKIVEALYEAPYLAHAPMEPLNCTVQLAPDRVDVWIGTQAPMAVLRLAAQQAGVAPENVYVHNHFVGGGFGRRTQHDELVHAIAAAKAVGKPVKLIWRREQDIRRDRYRPQAAVRFKAAMGPDGTPSAISSQVAVGSLLRSLGASKVENGVEPMAVEVIATHAYKIPNNRVDVVLKNAHVPVMFWRSVGASQNTFFLEGFIDELAHEAGQDPYQFRRKLAADRPDYVAVLDKVAKESGWGTPLPKGRGRGIAVVDTYGTVTAQVIEVSVSQAGKLKVERVVAAVDCYHAANPNTIAQQIEGGIVYGLTAAMHGEITIKDGAPVQGNFNDYPLLTLAETPPMETHLVLTGGPRWGGIGEPSVAPIAPALANAVFAATGKRVRKLPLKHADLSWA
ncbi:MAG: xanthine dehydrogenase family protein molybdopterin-binding subunit [Proteobacteria bacterium]|nr:xanthine dehydrogenase family protein molybdopterin-binding subunit [Pseudomonadota bacterium]